MTTISLRINPHEERLIKEYAKLKKTSVSALFRKAVLEKIEHEIDLDLYKEAIQEHQNNSQSISFDAMLEELSS